MARTDSLRLKLQRRVQEALRDLPVEEETPPGEVPEAAAAELPPMPPALALNFQRPQRRDYEEEIRQLRQELAASRLAAQEAKEAAAGAEMQRAITVGRAEEAERLERRAIELEAELAALRAAASEPDPRLKRLEAQLAEKDRRIAELHDALAAAEKRVLESGTGANEMAREKAERVEQLEREMTGRQMEFDAAVADAERSREELRQILLRKETEGRLLAENVNRLSQQNKELFARIQNYQASGVEPGAAPAAPAFVENPVNESLREQVQTLEGELTGRDRLLADNDRQIAAKQAQIEQLANDLKGMQEKELLVQDLTLRVQQLIGEREKLEEALKSGGAAPAQEAALAAAKSERAALEAQLKERAREVEDLKKAVEELKRAPSGAAAAAGSVPGEFAAGLQRQIADLQEKNEDLETQLRLVVMNSESIERMEKGLRDAFRLMGTSILPPAPPAGAGESVAPKEGLFARFLRRLGLRRAAPAPVRPGSVPPGIQRLRRLRGRG